MIHTHVLTRGGRSVESQPDRLGPGTDASDHGYPAPLAEIFVLSRSAYFAGCQWRNSMPVTVTARLPIHFSGPRVRARRARPFEYFDIEFGATVG